MKQSIALTLFCLAAFAQPQPRAESSDATLQALLQEVHALRTSMELTNRITALVQIAIAQMQPIDDHIRALTRQLQEAHEKFTNIQSERSRAVEHLKQSEAAFSSVGDAFKKGYEDSLNKERAAADALRATEQQLQSRENEAAGELRSEQGRWNQLNDKLKAYERALTQQ